MKFLNFLKLYPLTAALFILIFISTSIIFTIGIYKFALVILLSLIAGAIGYILDKSQILK